MNKLRSAALALLALTSVSTAAFAATNVVPKPPITTPVLPPKAAAKQQTGAAANSNKQRTAHYQAINQQSPDQSKSRELAAG
jgi:hypothetical protein